MQLSRRLCFAAGRRRPILRSVRMLTPRRGQRKHGKFRCFFKTLYRFHQQP
jgi:hypothetical protein